MGVAAPRAPLGSWGPVPRPPQNFDHGIGGFNGGGGGRGFTQMSAPTPPEKIPTPPDWEGILVKKRFSEHQFY